MNRLAGVLERHPSLRWAAPAAAVAAVAAVTLVTAGAASADDHPVLPPVSPEQLLADALQPTTQAFSGTVTLSTDLGLPELPGLTGAVTGTGVVPDSAASIAPGTSSGTTSPALAGLTALLSGDHTLRVWADGPDRRRVAVIADAIAAGDLHATRSRAKGPWRIEHDCLEAWLDARLCEHHLGGDADEDRRSDGT